MNTSVPVTNAEETFTGRVKWFNNKAGFGFITITDGNRSGTDIFVHHTSLKVDSEQYKYLVQGEYVDMKLIRTTEGPHEYQAGSVSGIKGGKLMCETRNEFRSARNNNETLNDTENFETVKMPRSVRPPSTRPQTSGANIRGQGPRESNEWSYQRRSNDQQPSRTSKPSRPRQTKTTQS